MENITKLFFTRPLPASNLFHIFRDGEMRSLCGNFGMLRLSEDMTERVKGEEKYRRGYDCKACFRKAGLVKNRDGKSGLHLD